MQRIRQRRPVAGLLLAACAALAGCAAAPPATETPLQPEAATGLQAPRAATSFARHAISAAHPLAAQAGRQMLREGGSAIDAAIAASMVLGLVEPQSSGIGGGSLLLHFDGSRVEAWDGRETAPAAADEAMFLRADGRAMAFHEAAVGGLAVGVPGQLAALEAAHSRHGSLPWARLFEPAIKLAEDGFPLGARLHRLLALDGYLKQEPAAARHFYDRDGRPWPVGHLLRNPELARTLRQVAAQGAAALQRGELARAIVAKIGSHPANPGRLGLEDLAAYRARERDPLCHDHASGARRWRICGFPPPGSGALAVAQILGLLALGESTGAPLQDGLPAADWLHRYAEAAKLAYADRAQHVADPDFVSAPGGDWSSLIDPAYLRERARLIGERSIGIAAPGRPGGPLAWATMPDQPEYGTTHLSVVDSKGRAVALTSSIEDAFGSRQWVAGFLLNNQLSDFSFRPRDAQGLPVANRVEPGKRPRSTMAPTLVFDRDSGELVLVAGSPGGALIAHYVARSLLATLDWGLDAQQAAELPNFGNNNGPTLLESNRFPAATLQSLRDRGHAVSEADLTSGVQLLQRSGRSWLGGADPRREGVTLGD